MYGAYRPEITVGRINIEEADGTKLLVISNRGQFPGAFENGKEIPRSDRRDFAGMIFVSDEGTENGGFIFKGKQGKEGQIDAGLSLTFDRFRQDQALQLLHVDQQASSSSAVMINDVLHHAQTSLEDIGKFSAEANKLPPDQQDAYWKKLADTGRLSQNRIFLGMTRDKGSALTLSDAKGKPRMLLLVTAQGQAEIQMLDENGKVVKKINPAP